MHPYQQISELIARYSENRKLGTINQKPVVNSLWHGILQKDLKERINNLNDINHSNLSSNELRIRYVNSWNNSSSMSLTSLISPTFLSLGKELAWLLIKSKGGLK